MERKTVKASYSIKMVATMKVNLKIMQSKVKANTLIKIIFGKVIGRMVTWREKVGRSLQKIMSRPLKISNNQCKRKILPYILVNL
jgi:hypothetical protein